MRWPHQGTLQTHQSYNSRGLGRIRHGATTAVLFSLRLAAAAAAADLLFEPDLRRCPHRQPDHQHSRWPGGGGGIWRGLLQLPLWMPVSKRHRTALCQLSFQPGLCSARKISPVQTKHRNYVRSDSCHNERLNIFWIIFLFPPRDLSRNEFTSLPTKLLSGLPNLKEINLEQNHITAVEDKTLENNSKLERMWVVALVTHLIPII